MVRLSPDASWGDDSGGASNPVDRQRSALPKPSSDSAIPARAFREPRSIAPSELSLIQLSSFETNDSGPTPALRESYAPTIVVVARRMLRKGKWVDFVGEYHLDLVRKHGGIPIVLPRIPNMTQSLHQLGPIDGVLLVEGEDVEVGSSSVSSAQREQVAKNFASDTAVDPHRDKLELELCQLCLDHKIPFLGICRGSQIMNKACGGELYFDISTEIDGSSVHLDPNDYDGHRHGLQIRPNTPLHYWMYPHTEIEVNSYHHQGIKRLANRFKPMAWAPDGLIEAYYDPRRNNPSTGLFLVGLQFHPERMVDTKLAADTANEQLHYDYPGCSRPFEDFVRAAAQFRAAREKSCTSQRPLAAKENHAVISHSLGKDDEVGRRVHRGKYFSSIKRTRRCTPEDICARSLGQLEEIRRNIASSHASPALIKEVDALKALIEELKEL